MPKPTWRGGECRILMLNKSTRELRAWQYLKIKEVFGCSDAELKFIRMNATTPEEVLGACNEWKPEAMLVGLNPDDPHFDLVIAAGHAIIKFDLSDRLVREGSNEIFAPHPPPKPPIVDHGSMGLGVTVNPKSGCIGEPDGGRNDW